VRPLSSTRRTVAALAAATALAATGFVTAGPAASAPAGPAAQVFWPNPVQSTDNESLTDQKDSDAAVPASAYHAVTLTNLDGSGYLRGDYAAVVSETGTPARAADGFVWTRHDDRFEQVMAYYWVTKAQLYIQSLGFGSTLPAVNKRQQGIRINQFGGDNSFYNPGSRMVITFGKGGVDDAEDAEVIVHEYGHSVQDSQVPGFGSTEEAGSIGEAFSDYLAVAVSDWAAGTPRAFSTTLPDEPCVADWDSVSYTRGPQHCLRRIDGTKMYPTDLVGEVHADGEIWSSALYGIRKALGASAADRLIINSQFGFTPDISFTQAAQITVNHATAAQKQAVHDAFAARGIQTTI